MTTIQIMAEWIKDETQDWLDANGKHIQTDKLVFDSNVEIWEIPTSIPEQIADDLNRCLFGYQPEVRLSVGSNGFTV